MKKKLSVLPFEQKLFFYLMCFALVLSITLIIENLIIDFPFEANYKWFLTFVLSIVALILTYQQRYFNALRHIVFIPIVFLILPMGWLSAGLYNSFTIAYSFLILIGVIFYFHGFSRFVYTFGIMGVMVLMMSLSIVAPELFLSTHLDIMKIDMLIQVPITFMAAALLLNLLMKTYRSEQEKLKEYALLLDEKNAELETILLTDDLTKIYNRRYILDFINDFIKEQPDGELLLGMVDIDDFKGVNDLYGHEVGDSVLRLLAQDLKTIVSNKGLVGRYGGDEFIIILYAQPKETAESVLKDLRNYHCRLSCIEHPIKISAGFALFSSSDDFDFALSMADKKLYVAKATGKNNLII